ncbi:uncharacterized protein LOC119441988 isoform X2 [Dermacentor silvarum]|nr:uncharacterized protein LOC119441988 isoform X2 [Dermacentor silvarum]XP_049517749.1 uncharacterized protein LOC119441988 isoform X2 [Dermacentor silvarum]
MSATFVRCQPQRKESQLLIKNLELLCIDPLHGAGFKEEDFRGKNASTTIQHVLHGLYCAYDKKAAQKNLKKVWPVKPGEPDKEFRAAIFTWISTLQENPIAAPFLQGFSAALLLRPGTPQYSMFLTGLSTFVLQDRLKDKIELASDFSHEALPLNVMKFSTQENKSSCVTSQKQLSEIEADYADQERHLKELLSNLNLSLRTLKAEVEKPDESFERLTQIHKELRDQNELISTRMGQIEEHCALMDGIITINLVGGLEKCNAIIDQFLKGYDKKTCEEQHLSVAKANVHLDAMKKTVERLQVQRETLERMKADVKQRLDEAIKNLPAEMVAGKGVKTTTSITRPQVNVEDFIDRLSAAFRNRSSRHN